MNRIEILAPAGSIESMKAAVNAGCDAVYLGGSKFGARAYADNLTEEILLSAIDYTHIRGKQLYLTVNTLLKEEEIKNELYEYLRRYYEQGLDAVIVQDVGVMHFIHEHFPNLPIHASTQMTLTMAEGINELKAYGVTRMVPARELTLKEIARIRKDTDVEIEAFVHGALCYSYSGQCLMSSMIGGRSGNRGRCAQPCRMEYKVEEDKKVISEKDHGYVLSPKDMCTLPMVAQMIEAGIDSFKIEGRMKRPEYTAGVVLAYKKQADLYYELGKKEYEEYIKSHPEMMKQEMQRLQDLYNRGGFSTGYYDMHNGKMMMSMDRPNHSGVLVGTVNRRKGIQAEIILSEDVNAQDILEFRHNGETAYEFTLKEGAKKGSRIVTNTKAGSHIELKDEVYRTRNNQLLNDISGHYLNPKKIKISGILTAKEQQPLSLTLSTILAHAIPGTNVKKEPQTITVTLSSDEVSLAQKQPMQAANIESKLRKTNETPFEFEHLEIHMDSNIFFPIGKLNELRRDALAALENRMSEEFRREKLSKTIEWEENTKKNHEMIGMTVTVKSDQQLEAALTNLRVHEIYLDVSEHLDDELTTMVERAKQSGKKVYYLMPHILRAPFYDEMKLRAKCMENSVIDGYVNKNFEALSYCRNVLKTTKEIRLDYNMYVMNQEAVKFYEEKGIHHFTAPVELNYHELKSLVGNEFELLVYGYLPLMISAQCVKKNTSECRLAAGQKQGLDFDNQKPLILVDRTQSRLMVRTNCHYCYNTIYNSQCISLLSNVDEVRELKPQSLRLDFTTEDGTETKRVLGEFEKVFWNNEHLDAESQAYSKGHFKRGVL